jgi:hypothetical protein
MTTTIRHHSSRMRVRPWSNGQGYDVGKHQLYRRRDGCLVAIVFRNGIAWRRRVFLPGSDPVPCIHFTLTYGDAA